jgi:AraC-like DNA-binding protein
VRVDDDTRRRLSRARDILEYDDTSSASSASAPIATVARRSGISTFHFIRVFEATFADTCGNLIQIHQPM